MASLGHDVEEATPDYAEPAMNASLALRCAGLMEREELPAEEELGDVVRFIYKVGQQLTLRDHVRALQEVQVSSRRIVSFFGTYDALLTPAIGRRPPRVGELSDPMAHPEGMMALASMAIFTAVWNNTGQPAVSVPFDNAPDGLPVCVQLVGRPNDETTLFRLSAQIERARPWTERRPPTS